VGHHPTRQPQPTTQVSSAPPCAPRSRSTPSSSCRSWVAPASGDRCR